MVKRLNPPLVFCRDGIDHPVGASSAPAGPTRHRKLSAAAGRSRPKEWTWIIACPSAEDTLLRF